MRTRIRGRFTTGDAWVERAKSEEEFKWVLEKVYSNWAVITDSISIEIDSIGPAHDGKVIWTASGGFTGVKHPKYMDRLLRG